MHVCTLVVEKIVFVLLFEANTNIRVTIGSNKSKARSSNQQSPCRRYGTHVLLSGNDIVAYDGSKICLLNLRSSFKRL